MALFALWRHRPADRRPPCVIHDGLTLAAHVEPALSITRVIETRGGRWHLFALATRTRFLAAEAQVDVDSERGTCVIHGLLWRLDTPEPRPLDAAAVSALLPTPDARLPDTIAGEYAVAKLHPCGTLVAFGDPAGLQQLFHHADQPAMVANRASLLSVVADDHAIGGEAGLWIATIGYRIGGATAWAGVRQLPADRMLVGDRILSRPDPIGVPPGPRGFAQGGAALLDAGIEQATAALHLATAGDDEIELPITGGKDSRAVLALCLAAGLGDRLRLFTRGFADHPDVIAGAAVAEAAGLPHRRVPPLGSDVPPDWPLDLFHANMARLAFQTDGGMGGWDLVTGRTVGADTLITGHMGELLKAYAKRPPAADLDPIALVRLQAPFDPLGIVRDPARAVMAAALADQLAGERARGATDADLPDLFYLRNRVPNWLGGIRAIKSFERQPVLPLGVPALTSLAFLMTAEERKAERAHFEIVARAAPALLAPPFAHQRWDPSLPGAPQTAPVVAAADRPLFGNWQYSLNTRPEIRAHLADLFARTDLPLWDAIDRARVVERLHHRRFDYFDGISLLGLTVAVYHGAGLLLTERLVDPDVAPRVAVLTPPAPGLDARSFAVLEAAA
jgi:hypothetical protein